MKIRNRTDLDDHALGDELAGCMISLKNLTRVPSGHITVEYLISGPILTALIICGIFGNILNIRALHGYKRRVAAINSFLIILACWDLILVISSFFLYNFSVLVNTHVVVHGDYVRAYPILFVVSHAAHTASIWCVVALAAERYFALCHPLRHRTKSNLGRIRITLLGISVASILASVPKFFEILIIECRDSDTGQTIPWVDSSPLRRHPLYSFAYIVVGGLLLHSLTPFVIMVILSIRVVVEVKRGATLRRRISARRSTGSVRSTVTTPACDRAGSLRSVRSEHLTRGESIYSRTSYDRLSRKGSSLDRNDHVLAVAVVAKFLICHFLPTSLDICERLMDGEAFEGPVVDVLVDISNVLVVLNSSINFLLYTAFSARFRRQVRFVMRCRAKAVEMDNARSLNSSMIRHSTSASADDRI